jgi:hypothetical protein
MMMSIKSSSLEAQNLQISGKFEVFKTLGYVEDDVVSSCPPCVCVCVCVCVCEIQMCWIRFYQYVFMCPRAVSGERIMYSQLLIGA